MAGHGGDAVRRLAGRLAVTRRAARRASGGSSLSNVLWIVWAWHVHAWALIALQVGLFAMNLRGAVKNTTEKE